MFDWVLNTHLHSGSFFFVDLSETFYFLEFFFFRHSQDELFSNLFVQQYIFMLLGSTIMISHPIKLSCDENVSEKTFFLILVKHSVFRIRSNLSYHETYNFIFVLKEAFQPISHIKDLTEKQNADNERISQTKNT